MIEDSILANLISNEPYLRKVIAFLKEDYFTDKTQRNVYKVIDGFVTKYNAPPTPESIKIELGTLEGLNENTYLEAVEYVSKLKVDEKTDFEWLVDKTEEFCKDKAFYNALLNVVAIADGSDKGISRGAAPKIIEDALAVSFDTSVGHDYMESSSERYDFYHTKEDRIPFDLDYLNKITKGGLPRKTLNILMAGCVHPETKVKVRLKKIS